MGAASSVSAKKKSEKAAFADCGFFFVSQKTTGERGTAAWTPC